MPYNLNSLMFVLHALSHKIHTKLSLSIYIYAYM